MAWSRKPPPRRWRPRSRNNPKIRDRRRFIGFSGKSENPINLRLSRISKVLFLLEAQSDRAHRETHFHLDLHRQMARIVGKPEEHAALTRVHHAVHQSGFIADRL